MSGTWVESFVARVYATYADDYGIECCGVAISCNWGDEVTCEKCGKTHRVIVQEKVEGE